ncbi:angio-associated migratory cell protein [Trichonephila clavipes]|uniref:Angio-associated migratory cell protein n=1 Tax=Trichonephila clavipes TaxID=2585209 RepID=A0A8X6VHW1_TRICX|nr:angio-associated migratory cell protein [Trichonephila clavipes]
MDVVNDDVIYEEVDGEIIEILDNDDSDLSFELHTDSVFCCNFNHNGELAVSGGQDEKAHIWCTTTGDLKFSCDGHTDSVVHASFNHDSSYVATAGMDGLIQVWNVETGTKEWDFETTEVTWMQWHPSSNLLFAGINDGNCWKWSIPDGAMCDVFVTHGVGTSCGHIFADGTKCAVGYADGTLKIWDINTSSVIGSVKDHTENVTCVTSSHDGNLLATGSEDGSAKLVNTRNCKVLCTWGFPSNEEKESVESIGFFKSHPFIAVGTSGGVLSIFDAATHQQRVTVNVELPIVKLICSETSPMVYVASGYEIQSYDARSGQIEKKWIGHHLSILDLTLSPNEEQLMSASDDFSCKIFATT